MRWTQAQNICLDHRVCSKTEVEWESNIVQARTEIPRAFFFSWQGGKNQWQKEEKGRNPHLDWLPNLLSSTHLASVTSRLPGCLTHHSRDVVTLWRICAMQWSSLCSAKMSYTLAATLTRNQKPYRHEYSTGAGLFRPAKMFFRQKRIPARAQHLANKPSKSTLCKVLPCGYTTLHLKRWVLQGNKSHLGLNSVIASTRPTSWDDGSHLTAMGPTPTAKIHWRPWAGRTQQKQAFLRSIVLQESSLSALSH